jgi:hypothetical protein
LKAFPKSTAGISGCRFKLGLAFLLSAEGTTGGRGTYTTEPIGEPQLAEYA